MLSLLFVLIPIVAGLVAFVLKGEIVKNWTLLAGMALMTLTGFTLLNFDTSQTNNVIDAPWLSILGSRFHLGIDGISMVMLILSTIAGLLIILSTLKDGYDRPNVFYGLVLCMLGAMNGVFVSLDLITYYIFWELALIPAYLLVIWWGRQPTMRTGLKFFFYTFLGSLLMLAAIVYIAIQNTAPSTDLDAVYGVSFTAEAQLWIFLGFMAAYAIKIPIFPFHTWQPDTYQKAPAPVTMLLSAIMLKMALYSIIRWVIPITPNAVETYGVYVVGLAVVGILYASLIAWKQTDIKRLFAYSSIAHVGLIAAGIMTVSKSGLDGAMVQMFAHAINAVGLFYVAHTLYRQTNSTEMSSFGGWRHKAPIFAGFYILVTMASVGLPLTNGFPGEFMLFNAVINKNTVLGILSLSGVILGAIYMLSSYQKVMLGGETTAHVEDADYFDKLVWIPIAVFIVLCGFFPSVITDISDVSIDKIISLYQSKLNLPTQ
jgi:NADH-quinone oxidoreductase subunit M